MPVRRTGEREFPPTMIVPLHRHPRPVDLQNVQPRRVCLIKPSALGDIVNALPVLTALRQRWPDAWIAWVVKSTYRGLLDGHPALDEVIAYERTRARLSPAGVARVTGFLNRLRRGEFDLAIDLQGLLRSGIMALATGAPVRVGLADAREGASRFYTHPVVPPGPRSEAHAVDRLLRVAEAFGADIARPHWVVPPQADDRAWARTVLRDVPRPRLVLHLGARWETKRWPPAHFAEVARRAAVERGAGIVAIGAPEDAPLVEALRRRLDPIPFLDLCGRTTLPQVAELAAESDVVLSNDSGPLHLAQAAGARVVGLYTCTSPRLNGPYGSDGHAVAVSSRVACAGSYLKVCPHLDCMRELTPDRVWPMVREQLIAAEAVGHGDGRTTR
jgi:lipopolysaccharide heptosyltransferase I